MIVYCDHCKMFLLQVPDNVALTADQAIKVMMAGYLARNTILYNDEDHWYFFCSDACKYAKYNSLRLPPARAVAVQLWYNNQIDDLALQDKVGVKAMKQANVLTEILMRREQHIHFTTR
jgi:hypothetical protein